MKKFFLLIGLFCFQSTKSVEKVVLVIKDQKLVRVYALLKQEKKDRLEAIKDTYPQAYAFCRLMEQQCKEAGTDDPWCMPPRVVFRKSDGEYNFNKNEAEKEYYNKWLENQKFGLIELEFVESSFWGISSKRVKELFFEQMQEYVETCDTDVDPWDKVRELHDLDSSAMGFEAYYKEKQIQERETFMRKLQVIYENEEILK